jgi:hypothetical protein
MFGPKHTIGSVASELASGLEDGTIALRPEEPTEADIKNFEWMAEAQLARYRRLEIRLWIITFILLLTSLSLPVILRTVFPHNAEPAIEFPFNAELVLVGGFMGMLVGNLLILKARKRSVELKTFIRVLKMADTVTAGRLVLWEGRKTREKWLLR